MKIVKTEIPRGGKAWALIITPRVRLSFGIVNNLDGVPLRYCLLHTRSYFMHIQSFQIHILRLRLAVTLPLRWKANTGPVLWSFPKMPNNKQKENNHDN